MPPPVVEEPALGLDLQAALARLGYEPAERLTAPLARSLARELGVDAPGGANLLVRVKVSADLPRRVLAALAQRFPDLVHEPVDDDLGGYVRGRKMAPTAERLRALLMKMSESDRLAGVSLEEMRTRLRGVFGPTARANETGAAFRELGWVRVRKWRPSEDGAFATRWFPPDSPEARTEVERLRRLAARRTGNA